MLEGAARELMAVKRPDNEAEREDAESRAQGDIVRRQII
jgi:hypothetical protein